MDEIREVLVGALLAVEWYREEDGYLVCPAPSCMGGEDDDGQRAHVAYGSSSCEVDAALTLAGLDTVEKRDAARAERAKK
jgi:hypothetical protein